MRVRKQAGLRAGLHKLPDFSGNLRLCGFLNIGVKKDTFWEELFSVKYPISNENDLILKFLQLFFFYANWQIHFDVAELSIKDSLGIPLKFSVDGKDRLLKSRNSLMNKKYIYGTKPIKLICLFTS